MSEYNLKQNVYNLINKAVTSLLPKVEDYRNYGKIYREYKDTQLNELKKDIPKNSRNLYKESLEEYSTKSYLEIIGQLTLIDLDIADYNIKKDLDKSLETSLSVGLTNYSIKIIDNLIDKKENHLDYKSKLLNGFLHLIKTKGDNSLLKEISKKEDILKTGEIIKTLQNTKYMEKLHLHRETLENLVKSELSNQKAENNLEKYNSALGVGKYSGKLVVDIISDYFPNFRERMEKHYIAKGKSANLFDDLKDFKIDKENKEGYTNSAIPLLLTSFSKEFVKSFIYLKPKSAWRYFNFLVLGGLFQLQEVVNLKERS